MALISFEDLAGLDDEQLDVDITDNPEPMDEEEEERLFAHWQSVGNTHQVSVPREMSGPIQEMTQQNQEQERVPFTPVSEHKKLGEPVYEERVYPAGKWACVTQQEELYEQSISMAFMKLMRYICKENSVGRYLGMTIPVLNEIRTLEDGSFSKEPTDPAIRIVQLEPLRVVTRVFFGTTTEDTVARQISLLWELLGSADTLRRDVYMVATYQNPGVPCRRNELWFIRRDP
ncbi:hypothetical protein COCON_G00038620 [Conger conger]|uniref:Uncharacterized protein n=1 Tax=Conger conger TaxID=82655 RepID=A0A9Q1I632_CONCO|nr:hypothetical protein COCON_G00038620 [Conger conger]